MGRPVTIGVLTPVTGGGYFGNTLSGIVRAAAAAGGRVLALQTLDPERHIGIEVALDPVPYQTRTAWAVADGFVAISTAVDGPFLRSLQQAGRPVVLVSHRVDGLACPSVAPDNRGGTSGAVTHLVRHGHRRIGFVGNLAQSDLQERYQGYQEALRAHGITPETELFFPAPDNLVTGGIVAGRALVAAGLPVTAVVAGTDGNGIGVLRALREAGRSAPDDLAVIGFDDSDEATRSDPPLSSVSVHVDHLGELAAGLLLRAVAGESVPPVVHSGSATLKTRGSCGCLPGTVQEPDLPDGGTSARERLAIRLRTVLSPEPAPPPSVERRLAEGTDAAISLFAHGVRDETGRRDLRRLAGAVHALAPRYQVVRDTMTVLRAYLDDLSAPPRPGDSSPRLRQGGPDGDPPGPAHGPGRPALEEAMLELALTVAAQDSARNDRVRTTLYRHLSSQYDVTAALLGSDDDPTTLSWLQWTDVPFGCLAAVPDADPAPASPAVGPEPDGPEAGDDAPLPAVADPAETLTVAGVHGDGLSPLLGRRIPIEEFPPPELTDRLDTAAGEVLYVLAVRSGTMRWGILAAPGPIDVWAVHDREVFNHLAAQLCIALRQRSQRQELTAAYHRTRQLAENLRISEERYALAVQAANDGLWDWDLDRDTVFYSDRWDRMLGCQDQPHEPSPKRWLDRVHPDDLDALEQAVADCRHGRTSILEYEHRLRTADGAHRWMLCRALVVHGEGGRPARLVGSLTDIDDRRRLEERLRHGALYDELTGLANRKLFLERLAAVLADHRAGATGRFAVLFGDLDGFKQVNDTLGHSVGDLLLATVATRLTESVRAKDLAARMGGDEFAVLVTDVGEADPHDLGEVADRIRAAVSRPYLLEGHEVRIGMSIGIAVSDQGHLDASDMLRAADGEMYREKSRTRQPVR